METITTDVTIRGPLKHGMTGEPYYEAMLPLGSPAQEYIRGCPCASGSTPYAAMMSLASKYPWGRSLCGPLVGLEFAGPAADKIARDYHACPDCGEDEREAVHVHAFECKATEEGRERLAEMAEEAAAKRLADAAPDLLAALKHLAMVYTLTGDHIDDHPLGAGCSLCEAREAITKATTEEG